MAQFFIIDGYNLLHAMGVLKGRTGPHGLEKARANLLGRIAGAMGKDSASVTVVFDSTNKRSSARQVTPFKGIEVLFAVSQHEADDLIEELIAKYSAPRQMVVVSDDRRLKKAATRRKAQTMSCEAFLRLLVQKRHTQHESPSDKPEVDMEDVDYWLEQFSDLELNREMKKMLDPTEVDERL